MTTETLPAPPLWRRAIAELIGTGLLVAVVVGSGIAAQRLSPDDVGLQLLENGLATTLGLAVLILLFSTVSGSHFNPVVTLVDAALQPSAARGGSVLAYVVAQVAGAIGGSLLANTMVGVATTISTTERADAGRLLGEVVATAGLVLLIFALVRTQRTELVAPAVGAYIGAAYWFTSSTSFANPAITVGRIFTDTFAGIEPGSALWFIGAELVGGATGFVLVLLFFPLRSLHHS